ncbi:MAG: tail fiber domain-containing protein [Verrucomicrobia bacterium]|nr:tail fiber domain-containing protein [Verrucomicrobiota bacterium]
MKTIRSTLLLLGAGMLLISGWAAETVPGLVSYQGLLVNPDNSPLANGNHPVQFSLWDQAQNGTRVWGPQSNVVAVYNGQFNVLLGPTDAHVRPLAEAFRDASRFLEIQVGNNPPIAPRQQILSAPFALNARTLDATNWSAVFDNGNPATGTIPGSRIGPGTIASSQIAANAITSAQIIDGTITTADLGTVNLHRLSASDGDPANAVFVNANGYVGIGTSNPSQLLDVYHGHFRVSGYTMQSGDPDYNGTPYTLITSNKIILQAADVPYVGPYMPATIIFDPAYRYSPPCGIELLSNNKLRVFGAELLLEGKLTCTNLPTTSYSANAYIDSGGRLCKSTSSRRYKEQIEPLHEDFSKILDLEPKQYVRRGAGPDREFGYIAEEVEEAGLKGLTVYDRQGRPDAVDYPRMVIYANEVLKEHQSTIQSQQRELEALKAEVQALKSLLKQSR